MAPLLQKAMKWQYFNYCYVKNLPHARSQYHRFKRRKTMLRLILERKHEKKGLCQNLCQIRRDFILSLLLLTLSGMAAVPVCAAPARIGIASQPLVSLAIVAERQGLFTQGLRATVRHYPSGKHALEALLAGQVDIATVAETPLIFSSFERQDFSIFATIGCFSNEQRIVANRQSGIITVAELNGRVVAAPQGSAVHVVALNRYINAHPDAVVKTVRALINAEEFYRQHPSGALKLVANELKMPEQELARHLKQLELRVSLDQSMLVGLEDEARWALETKLTGSERMPNYLNFLYLDALQAARPASISIIR